MSVYCSKNQSVENSLIITTIMIITIRENNLYLIFNACLGTAKGLKWISEINIRC